MAYTNEEAQSPHLEQKEKEKKKLIIQLRKYDDVANQRQFPAGELLLQTSPSVSPQPTTTLQQQRCFKVNMKESLLSQHIPLQAQVLRFQCNVGVISKGKKSPSHLVLPFNGQCYQELNFYSGNLEIYYKIFRQGQLQILIKHYQAVKVFLVPFDLTLLAIGKHIVRQTQTYLGQLKQSIHIPVVVRQKHRPSFSSNNSDGAFDMKRLSMPECRPRKLSVADDREYVIDGKLRVVFGQNSPEEDYVIVNEVI